MALKEIEYCPQSWKDPETGAEVTRHFPDTMPAVHAYFTSTSYDAEGRLILSAQIDGEWQIVRIDRQAGSCHVLTDLHDFPGAQFCVGPGKNIAIVKTDNAITRLNLENGETREIFRTKDNWYIALPTITQECDRIAFSIREPVPEYTKSGKIYSSLFENFYYHPKSLVMAIDLEDESRLCAWGENNWISHVLIHPHDKDTIVFCHEGGLMPDHRLWVVDARQNIRKKKARPLFEEAYEDFLVHEFFMPDGTVGVQWRQFPPGQVEADFSTTKSSLLHLNTDGTVIGDYLLPAMHSMHYQGNSDASLFVSDAYYPDRDTDMETGGKYMALHRRVGDNLTVEKLCRHDSSLANQHAHPHAIFSPGEKEVLFSSDAGGVNSVYTVKI